MTVLQPGTPEYEAEMARKDAELEARPKKTRAVHVHNEFDVYCGRANSRAKDKRCHVESVFANPFTIGEHGTREECIQMFRELMHTRLKEEPEKWRTELLAVKGKRLGCWCKPKACHCDVIAQLADAL